MVRFTSGNGETQRQMDLGFTLGLMETSTRVNGKIF